MRKIKRNMLYRILSSALIVFMITTYISQLTLYVQAEEIEEEIEVGGEEKPLAEGEEEDAEILYSGVIDEDYGHYTWTVDKNWKLVMEGTGDYTDPTVTGTKRKPVPYSGLIKSAEIRAEGMTNTALMFSRSSVEEIDMSACDTSNVTDMRCMFWFCEKLRKVNLGGRFSTENAVDMHLMFAFCENLENIDLSNFNTSKAETVEEMFSFCRSLTSVDLSGFTFETEKIKLYENGMMEGDVNNLIMIKTPRNLDAIVTLPLIFDEDTSEYIYEGERAWRWYMPDGTEVATMPLGLEESVELVKRPVNAGNMSGSYGNINWNIDENGKLTVTGSGDFAPPDVKGVGRVPWYPYNIWIKSAVIDVKDITDTSYMFYNCSNLTDIDLSGLDTVQTTNMEYMFSGCARLDQVDVQSFNTGNVTNMRNMFSGCSSLNELSLQSFNTGKVTNMKSMFANSGLVRLDLSGCDTGNVTDMGTMFMLCRYLSELNLKGNFKTDNVINMSLMFAECSNLSELDLSNCNIANVKDMEELFADCYGLTKLDTPLNANAGAVLPVASGEAWYDESGNTYTELPQNLSSSIKLVKNEKHVVLSPHIVLKKDKLIYEYGEKLNIDDITVTYYNEKGMSSEVTDYITNADEIDMSVPGKKLLIVIYNNGSSDLTESIEITVNEKTEDPEQSAKPENPFEPEQPPEVENPQITSLYSSDRKSYIPDYPSGGYIYTGTAQRPKVVVLDSAGEKFQLNRDYSLKYTKNVNAGEAKVTVKGKGRNKAEIGTKEIVFTIRPAELDEQKFIISPIKEKTYMAKEQKPSIKIWMKTKNGKKKVLKAKKDYTLTYTDNMSTGEASITITAKENGNYTGSLTCSFRIEPKSVRKGIKVSKIAVQSYNGSAVCPEPVVKFGRTVLLEGTDYTLSYRNNTERGRAEIIITGTGNYTGELKRYFKII